MDLAQASRRLRNRLKSLPPVYWSLRWIRMKVGDVLPPRQLAGVPGRIHANDSMIPKRIDEHVPGYVGSGRQVAALIGSHLGGSARTGLDFGCGYGRVLRHLVADLPSVRWTAADVDPRAVRFCRQEFAVTGIVSSHQLDQVRFPDAPFDVVWMGSLLTHLSPTSADALWTMVRASLRPGGLLALSTHGPGLVDRIDEWVPNGSQQLPRVTADLATAGVGYVQYPHYRRVGYGIAFHTAEAMGAAVSAVFGPGTELLELVTRGWLETQDLYVFRAGAPAPGPG